MVDEDRERRLAPMLGVRAVDRWLRFVGEAEAHHVRRLAARAELCSGSAELAGLVEALEVSGPPWDVHCAASRLLAVAANRHADFCGRCAIGLPVAEPVWQQGVDVSMDPSNRRVQRRWLRTTVCGRCARRDRSWWAEPCVVCGRQVHLYSARAKVVTCCVRHRRVAEDAHRRSARHYAAAGRPESRCQGCGDVLGVRRLGTKWCTEACRVAAYRRRKASAGGK